MKKLVLLLALCLMATNSWAAITVLAQTCKGSSNGTSVTTTAINTKGATLIFLSEGYASGGGGTVSDSQSNTPSGLANPSTGDISYISYYYVNPITSTSHTFSVSGGTSPALCVIAASGTIPSPLDVQNSNAGSSATLTTGNVTPSQFNEILLSGIAGKFSTTGLSAGYTNYTPIAYSAGVTVGIAQASFIYPTKTGLNAQWIITASVFDQATGVATFIPNLFPSLNNGTSSINGVSFIN